MPSLVHPSMSDSWRACEARASGTVGVVLMVVLAGAGFQLVAHRDRVPAPLFPAVAAVVLCALLDPHGFALLAGVLAGGALKAAGARTAPAASA